MPAITYGYLPVVTRALTVADKTNFTTTIATQGAYTQSATPVVTNFVMYETSPGDNATVTGVSVRCTTVTPGVKPTISVFSLDSLTGTITSLVTPLLDTAAVGDHEISVPLTLPVKFSTSQKLIVFVGGQDTTAGLLVKGVLMSFVPGP